MKATEDVVQRVGVELFGVRGWAILVMYSVVLVALAPRDAGRGWVLEQGPMSRVTRYRRVAQLDRLRRELTARGYDVSTVHSALGEAMWRAAA